MNSNKIETGAIICLESLLWKCPHIDYSISRNDKGLSWDGFIYLYSDKNQKKENLVCKCEIQIKGKEKIGKSRSYAVSVADLNNYKNNGGVIFFVIDIETEKVFYSELLPTNIGHILQLKLKKKSQKTININLEEFPKSSFVIENLVNQFCKDSDKQRASKGKIISLQDEVVKLNGDSCFQSELKLIQEKNAIYLSDKSTYLYKLNADGTILPLNIVKIKKAKNFQDLDIYINNKFWRKLTVECVLTQRNEQPYLLLNNNIYIYYNKGAEKSLEFTLNGVLADLKDSVELMNAIIQGHEIKIGDLCEFRMCSTESQKKDFDVLRQELLDIINVLEYFRADKILSFEQLTEGDLKQLLWMSERIANFKEISNKDVTGVNFEFHQFNSFRVIMLIVKDNKEDIWFLNPFNFSMGISKSNNNSIIYPFFIFLDEKELECAINVDYGKMLTEVNTFEFKDGCSGEITSFILRALLVIDKTNNMELLTVVTRLAERLYEYDSNIINFINYLQCVRRERDVTQEEAEILLNLFDNSGGNNLIYQCAVSLILKNKYTYNKFYKQLNDKERDKFNSYPIKFLEELLSK